MTRAGDRNRRGQVTAATVQAVYSRRVPPTPFWMASCNLHWGVHPGGCDAYDVGAALDRCRADVVAVQEAWMPDEGPDLLSDYARERDLVLEHVALARGRFKAVPEIVLPPDPGTGTWGLAVLSRWPVSATRRVDLGKRWGDPAHRQALLVRVESPDGPLLVANAHLSFRPPNAWAQLRLVLDACASEEAAVVAGDLNLPASAIRLAARGWQLAVRGPTFPAGRERLQLDHLLCSRAVGVRAGAVVAATGSDHRPVRAQLALPTRANS